MIDPHHIWNVFTKRGPTKGSLQLQQILRLPRKMNLMIDRHRIWNVIYNTQSNRHHPPTSPNTAPATQNESHDWSASHMKRHLQCAEQQSTPSNLTKYCACHAKWISWLIHITYDTSFTMRGATGITFQPHQILRLPRKMNLMIDPHHIWYVIYNARSNRHHLPTSPNTAPATQNESHDWSTSHMTRHLQCAEQQASPSNLTKYCACHANESHDWSTSHMTRHLQCAEQQKASPSNLTKYCACHAKWISWLIHITYDTSFTMRGATGITFQPHQILRLPRKMTTQHLTEIGWKQVKRHFQCATDPRPFREWSENDPTLKTQNWTRRAAKATFRTRQEQHLLKITTFPAPAIIPNFTTCCTCHEKWHMNFTKCCACHKKWHMNFTKCCTCHEKWHMNFTKCCTCHKKWHMNFYQMLHLPRKVTHELHQMLHLPQKVTHELYQMLPLPQKSDTWTLPNAAPATKSDTKWHHDYYHYY